MSNFDRLFDDLLARTLGFENLINEVQKRATLPSFPPYNLLVRGDSTNVFDNEYVLQLALAGYAPEDIEVSLARNVLTVESAGGSEESQKYFHKGIAKRAFKLSWPVADGVEVVSAKMNNGLLEVVLSAVALKPEVKKIPVIRD